MTTEITELSLKIRLPSPFSPVLPGWFGGSQTEAGVLICPLVQFGFGRTTGSSAKAATANIEIRINVEIVLFIFGSPKFLIYLKVGMSRLILTEANDITILAKKIAITDCAMKKVNLTSAYLQECLKKARFYEFCKDSERALAVIRPIWANIEEPPDTSDLSERDAWEVLLICGSVISSYGSTHQKKHYQELAADMLTRARDAAVELGERDLIAESEKQLATAYWLNGQVDNALAFLNTALSKYSDAEQLTNTICLLVQTNLLMLSVKNNQFGTAFETFEKLKPFVDGSDDLHLKTTFYNQAAGIFVVSGNFKNAIPLLEKAVEYSSEAGNNTYLGSNLNNLANAYINLPVADTKKAMKYVDDAMNLFLSINQVFPYALALETKANIYAQTGDYKKALSLINQSIKFLEEGENYDELCESLWTRTEILIKTGEKKLAIKQFNDLIQTAVQKMSVLAGDEYTDRFSKLIYLPIGKNLEEKEKNFRQHLLDEALAVCGGIVTTTANHLGVMHQTLSAILKKFPALVEKHQVKLRTRSGLPKLSKTNANKVLTDMFVMRIQSDRLSYLGLSKGKMIGVVRCQIDELNLSKPVVIEDSERKYHCGFLVDAFGMLAFEDGCGNIERTFMPSEIVQAGQISGIYNPETNEFTPFEK